MKMQFVATPHDLLTQLLSHVPKDHGSLRDRLSHYLRTEPDPPRWTERLVLDEIARIREETAREGEPCAFWFICSQFTLDMILPRERQIPPPFPTQIKYCAGEIDGASVHVEYGTRDGYVTFFRRRVTEEGGEPYSTVILEHTS